MKRDLSAPGIIGQIRRVDAVIAQLTVEQDESPSAPGSWQPVSEPAVRVALRSLNDYRTKLAHDL